MQKPKNWIQRRWHALRSWLDTQFFSTSIIVYRVEDPAGEMAVEDEAQPKSTQRRYPSGEFRL